jgi:hypothetical protein
MESNNIMKPYVYSFYVNELLKTASKDAPDPPKECVWGGIFADAMGLGKTVMLLALIGKDKEEREGNLIYAPLAIDTTQLGNRRFGDVPNSLVATSAVISVPTNASDFLLTDDTYWGTLYKSEIPDHVFYYADPIDFVLNPWYNIEDLNITSHELYTCLDAFKFNPRSGLLPF